MTCLYRLKNQFKIDIVGFLNTAGGELYIGVDNSGKVCGLENADKTALRIGDRIKDNINPSTMGLYSVLIKTTDENKKYIVISVSGGYEKPYHLKQYGLTPKGCYTRIGTQTAPMHQSMIDELYSRRVPNTLHKVAAPRQNLTFSQLKIYYEEKGFNVGEYFLKNLDFYTDDGKFNYAAFLMADNNTTSISVVKYHNDYKDIQKKKDFGGYCLIKTAFNVLDTLNNYNETAVEITYPNRIDTHLIDPIALREAALNAILHNDYINCTTPLFEVYDNRIVIVSSGGLPHGLSQEEFFAGKSLPRHREIMRIFKDMELCEQFGSGMTKIMRAYKPEDYLISKNFVTAKFMYDKHALGIIDSTIDKVQYKVQIKCIDDCTLDEKSVIASIINNPTTTQTQIAQEISKSLRTIKNIMASLQKKGIIEREGAKKSGQWRVNLHDVFKRDDFRCVKCGITQEEGAKLYLDHIQPISKGGLPIAQNLQTLCAKCNMNKNNKL